MQHPSSLVGPEVKKHVLNLRCSRDGTAPRAERRSRKGRAALSDSVLLGCWGSTSSPGVTGLFVAGHSFSS